MFRLLRHVYNTIVPPSYKQYEASYFYRANKLYRIWFSNNPDVFLGLENELRFIRMRENNKKAEIYFIYSSRSLNETAKANLHAFCKQHQITPVDFDTELLQCLHHDADKELYDIAKDEFNHALNKTGGNLAAPSDCIRQIIPVIERYGFYSDFDVDVQFDKLPASEFTTESPVLFNGDYYNDGNGNIVINPNSDFLAYAYDPESPDHLHPDAVELIRQVQQRILANYQQPFNIKILYANPKELEPNEIQLLEFIFSEFQRVHANDPSVFNFRLHLQALKENNQAEVEALFIFLNDLVGICVSGPGNYKEMFVGCRPAHLDYFPRVIKQEEQAPWEAYFSIFYKSRYMQNPQLEACITSNNCTSRAKALIAAGKHEEVRDSSWTEEGIALKQQRELKLRIAATRMFQIWRTGLATHKELNAELKPVASAEVMKSIRNGQYNLALRLASYQSNFAVITLLMKYKDQIHLDINDTTSKGQTALDLATDQAVRELLVQNGAKSGNGIAARRK